ncbi:hypothetical protein BJY00DRAFT_58664 [Aspergillus carlsbadensis]|nr:hypothetical protein BJY00DRAFT_58664 [Aspergillus carlsbadensis]
MPHLVLLVPIARRHCRFARSLQLQHAVMPLVQKYGLKWLFEVMSDMETDTGATVVTLTSARTRRMPRKVVGCSLLQSRPLTGRWMGPYTLLPYLAMIFTNLRRGISKEQRQYHPQTQISVACHTRQLSARHSCPKSRFHLYYWF